MKKRMVSLGLAVMLSCGLLTGCGEEINDIPVTIEDLEIEEETVDYTQAPEACTYYVGQHMSAVSIPNDSVVETQDEVPEVQLSENQSYEPVFTSTEVSRIEEIADTEISYDGNTALSFTTTDPNGVLDLYHANDASMVATCENPYEDAARYVTEVTFDESVTKLEAGTLRGFTQPIKVTLPGTLKEIDDNFVSVGVEISGFEIAGESDTLKVIGDALYIYREDLGGWALARYATASTATSFTLPEEIDVVYIYPEAFAWNMYLQEIDISASSDIKLGYNAFAAIPALYVTMAGDTDPYYIYENSGCTFKYFTIGLRKTNCEELGIATLEPDF